MAYTKTFDELNLHFYPKWKEKLLETARDIGFPEELIASCSAEELFNIIKDHQIDLVDLSRRMIATQQKISLTTLSFLTPFSIAKRGC